ncbi:hypothetical protein BJ875DRAFT_46340 [Amylocarpus encephaloides]|uniref:GEgh 16 protein n=1 Tax=Amylocarpus encephaloides TaxID=45428 RepID=A0A9P8C4P6_9HELO|nr:hypothetical protein BJ875DRAFT_46340 [Amylocarpus encephaloides]
MHSSSIYNAAALYFATLASGHGVILQAQGESGSPASVGFQVDPNIARNCTGISPCQQDTTIIRDAEIAANVVNQCGRTELTGNIDVGENTENALAAGAVTQVQAGTVMEVIIHQVNADGAGPYVCDLDQTSNAGVISQNLTVTDNVPGVNGLSQAKTQDFTIKVAMPDNLACTGASTGNICTVRCRNNALAGPFGGCFAVQQTDVTAQENTAQTNTKADTVEAVDDQVAINKADLPVAIAANQNAGTPEALAAASVAADLAGLSVTSSESPTQTLAQENIGTTSAAAATSAATGNGRKGKANGATNNGATRNGNNAKAVTGNRNGRNGGNNNNKRRGLSLKWAKRAMSGSS